MSRIIPWQNWEPSCSNLVIWLCLACPFSDSKLGYFNNTDYLLQIKTLEYSWYHERKFAPPDDIIFLVIQVCLMSQSWNNGKYAWVIHSSKAHRKVYLPSCIYICQSLVQCACQLQQHKLWTYWYYFVDHTPRCRSIAAAWTRPHSVESTTRLWRRTDLVSSSCFTQGSVACWAGLSKHAALHAVCSRMHL